MNNTAAMSADAALALGLASTAMPFARDPLGQAERWLRVLAQHGETGAILGCVSQVEGEPQREVEISDGGQAAPVDPVEAISDRAMSLTLERRSPCVRTSDVLLAVLDVYGQAADIALQRRGTHAAEVRSQVARHARSLAVHGQG